MRHGPLVAEAHSLAPGLLGEQRAVRAARREPRRGMYALDLASNDGIERPVPLGEEQELDAGRACVQDEDRVTHATTFAAFPRRTFAIRAATAQEARRADQGVGTAGENNRHARAEHDAGSVSPSEKRQALGQHVAGFEIGHDQHVGAPSHRRIDLLDLAWPRG